VSRLLVYLIPVVVIAAFMVMAHYERRLAHDPTHRGFFERNGTALGLIFIGLVAFWTLMLVVLPYLYMVQESFHPKLVAADRGGPKDILTIDQYRSFFIQPTDGTVNTTHLWAFFFTLVSLEVGSMSALTRSCSVVLFCGVRVVELWNRLKSATSSSPIMIQSARFLPKLFTFEAFPRRLATTHQRDNGRSQPSLQPFIR